MTNKVLYIYPYPFCFETILGNKLSDSTSYAKNPYEGLGKFSPRFLSPLSESDHWSKTFSRKMSYICMKMNILIPESFIVL